MIIIHSLITIISGHNPIIFQAMATFFIYYTTVLTPVIRCLERSEVKIELSYSEEAKLSINGGSLEFLQEKIFHTLYQRRHTQMVFHSTLCRCSVFFPENQRSAEGSSGEQHQKRSFSCAYFSPSLFLSEHCH